MHIVRGSAFRQRLYCSAMKARCASRGIISESYEGCKTPHILNALTDTTKRVLSPRSGQEPFSDGKSYSTINRERESLLYAILDHDSIDIAIRRMSA